MTDRKHERWGILGGSFDPVHNGHLHLARGTLAELRLDRVVCIPASTPPHKLERTLAPARDRTAMLRLALSGESRIDVDEMEIERGGVSYTWQTLEHLAAAHANVDLFFLIGSDSLEELETWRRIDRIAELVTFAVLGRGADPVLTAPAGLLAALKGTPLNAIPLALEPIPVSSTEIRVRVARGETISALVPPGVSGYIAKQSLYR